MSLPGCQLVVDLGAAVEDDVAKGVDHRSEAETVAVHEEVGAVDPGEPVADVQGLDLNPGRVGDVGTAADVVVTGLLALVAEVDQGVGASGGPHIRVVQRVRPVAGLRGRLKPDDSPVVEGLGDGVEAVGVAAGLGDCHGLNIPRSSATLHSTCYFLDRINCRRSIGHGMKQVIVIRFWKTWKVEKNVEFLDNGLELSSCSHRTKRRLDDATFVHHLSISYSSATLHRGNELFQRPKAEGSPPFNQASMSSRA